MVLAIAAAVVIAWEGYGGPFPIAAFPTAEMTADGPAYAWLRTQPRGPALELPVGGADVATRHLYRTLAHGNRIVNGYSGYGSALQDFVGGPPFTEIGRFDDALGDGAGTGPAVDRRAPAAVQGSGEWCRDRRGRTRRDDACRTCGDVRGRGNRGVAPRGIADVPARRPGLARGAAAHVHGIGLAQPGRPPQRLRRDRDTRWFTGERQRGREWIELRFRSSVDVARVRLEMDRRSNGDYPRGLVVEGSEDPSTRRSLFEGGILPLLGVSIAREPRTPGIDLVLPPNTTRVLRLRTTGETRVWYWSVHELRVWTRQ